MKLTNKDLRELMLRGLDKTDLAAIIKDEDYTIEEVLIIALKETRRLQSQLDEVHSILRKNRLVVSYQ